MFISSVNGERDRVGGGSRRRERRRGKEEEKILGTGRASEWTFDILRQSASGFPVRFSRPFKLDEHVCSFQVFGVCLLIASLFVLVRFLSVDSS